ncbi:MAG: hypothetical protein LPJ87_07590 [Zoogloeaceae bacterium]|nr:hypothetical protein [Zoogloeaceae bacterium]
MIKLKTALLFFFVGTLCSVLSLWGATLVLDFNNSMAQPRTLTKEELLAKNYTMEELDAAHAKSIAEFEELNRKLRNKEIAAPSPLRTPINPLWASGLIWLLGAFAALPKRGIVPALMLLPPALLTALGLFSVLELMVFSLLAIAGCATRRRVESIRQHRRHANQGGDSTS